MMFIASEEQKERVKAIDHVVGFITSFEEQQDATVQLHVLKACLTAITAPGCELHDISLMKAIRTCFNIYLAGVSPLNIVTAQGIIRQSVHHVFSQYEIVGAAARMELIEEQALARQKHEVVQLHLVVLQN